MLLLLLLLLLISSRSMVALLSDSVLLRVPPSTEPRRQQVSALRSNHSARASRPIWESVPGSMRRVTDCALVVSGRQARHPSACHRVAGWRPLG